MLISRFVLVATIAVGFGLSASAQVVPGNPLSPSAGYAAQRAGVLPIGSGPTILGKEQFFLSTLSSSALPGKTETVLRYGVTERLSVGLSYLQKQATLRPDASFTITPETVEVPSLTVGLFHDTIGGGREAYYATAGRTITDMGDTVFSGYVGIAKYSSERAPRPLLGAALPLAKGKLTASAQWEGKKLSFGLVADVGRVSGYSIRLGLVTVGDNVGPLAATTWNR